jgi:hypothetical protein
VKNNYVLSSKVDIYDLATGAWSSASLTGGARTVGAAVTAENKVLFCGGYTKFEDVTIMGYAPTTTTASIDIYDANTGQWSAGSMQVSKASFAAISFNEKVYLAGGVVNNTASFHVEELNVNTMNSFESCLHQRMTCYIGKGAAIKNDMILFLNYSPYTGVDNNEFDIYNIQTGVWSIGVLPAGLIKQEGYTPMIIESANNEIYTVIGTKLYRMNL